jgi:hypothetical protein
MMKTRQTSLVALAVSAVAWCIVGCSSAEPRPSEAVKPAEVAKADGPKATDKSPGSTNAERDAALQAQLTKMGVDKQKPREAIFYVYAKDEKTAKAIAAELRTDGWKTDVHLLPEFNQWSCTATKTMPVDERTIAVAVAKFEELAAKHGCEYDGWECAMLEGEGKTNR